MAPSTIALIIIIILNTFLAIGILIYSLMRKKGKLSYIYFAVIFLCPVIGAAYFFCSFLLYRFTLRDKELTYADISFDSTRHEKKQKGDIVEEVDILPLEEAFVVSEKKDRRRALLTTLKKDYSKNISSILMGLNNEDSETSHYAASVVLSTSTEYLNLLSLLRDEYTVNASEENSDPAHAYLEGLKEYMQSDIMDNIDKRKYIRVHTEVMSWLFKYFKDEIDIDDYVYQITLLIEVEDFEEAQVWANRAIHNYAEEDAAHYITMKLYYHCGEYDKFLQTLEDIMRSNMNISNETLQTIRFFNYQPSPVFQLQENQN